MKESRPHSQWKQALLAEQSISTWRTPWHAGGKLATNLLQKLRTIRLYSSLERKCENSPQFAVARNFVSATQQYGHVINNVTGVIWFTTYQNAEWDCRKDKRSHRQNLLHRVWRQQLPAQG